MENFEVDLSEDDENFSNKDGTEVTQESLDEIKQNYSFIENLFSIKRAFQKKDKDGFRKIVFFLHIMHKAHFHFREVNFKSFPAHILETQREGQIIQRLR